MIAIRPEESQDVQAIRRLLVAAFPTSSEADLVDALRASHRLTLSWVAETDGEVLGHIAMSQVCLEPSTKALQLLGLAPVAVLPEHQQSGIGSALVRHALAQCEASQIDAIVVLGDPAFYHRFGFQRASNFSLQNEYQVDEHFMALELRAGRLDGLNCLAKYAPPFSLL